MRRIHVFTCAMLGLLVAGSGLTARGQAPTAAARALTLDVWVRDRQGQPVSNLAAGDFVVQVDGQQRRVTAARFVNYASMPSPGATSAEAVSSSALPGRAMALVIDERAVQDEDAARLGDAAARWVEQLHPADRVAVVPAVTGRGGPVVFEAPRDAAVRVRAASAIPPPADTIGLDETEFLLERRTIDQAEAIASAVSWLASEPGPRVLVVLSGGMAMPLPALRYLSTSVRVALDAGISAYFVTPAAPGPSSLQPASGGGWNSVPVSRPSPGGGLEQIAASLRGRVLRAHGPPDEVLAEIGRDVSAFYRLEVDGPSAGPLPRSLPVMVSVRPAGLVARSGDRVMSPPALAAARTTAERTRDILTGVDTAAAIAFDATTALTLDTASADQLHLTIGLALPADLPSPVRVTIGLTDEAGTLRFSTTDVPDAEGGPRRASVAMSVAPGWHRLTLVAEDGRERLGSIHQAVHARLRAIGSYAVADPRMIWRTDAAGWQMLGGEAMPESAVAAASLFELYPGSPGLEPPPLPLRLEDETGREVAMQMLTPTPVGHGWRLLSEVMLDGLEPGAYVVRLDTTALDSAVTPPHLRFRKVTPATRAIVAAASAAPPLPDAADLINLFRAGVRDDWPRFVLDDLLVADLLGSQLKALSGSRPLPAALANATGDAWWAALRATGAQRSVTGMAARGLTALRDGDRRAAESFLRDAAAESPAPAARRLLGLVHAASGRDDAAAGVWSMSIDAATDDPRWSLAFAEALGRVGDFPAALDTLRRIPGEASGRRAHRIVDTLIVLGRTDDALDTLVVWEAGEGREQPDGRLTFYLVALRYAAALQPGASAGAINDFHRLADRYVAADGEYAEMVTAWRQSTAALMAR